MLFELVARDPFDFLKVQINIIKLPARHLLSLLHLPKCYLNAEVGNKPCCYADTTFIVIQCLTHDCL